jgi:anti-sigma B factor antagonist
VDLLYEIDHAGGGDLTLRLAGELDINTADELCDLLLAAIGAHDGDVIDVDLDRVTFLDSSAIAALVRGFNAAGQAGCRFRVSKPHGVVSRALDVTGVSDHLSD